MRASRQLLAVATAGGVALVLAGCYSYRAVPLEQVPVGAPVRARLSPVEAERVGQILGRDDRLLEGRLLERQPGSGILIAVPTNIGADATAVGRTYQRIAVPPEGLVEVEIRRLDKARTGWVVGAVATVVAAATAAAFVAERGKTDAGDKGGVNRLRMPRSPGIVLLRIKP